MSSLRDRVLKRKLFSPIVKVPFPTVAPEFIFEVARFSPAEMDCARVRARRLIEDEGLRFPSKLENDELESGPGIARAQDYNIALARATAFYLQRHVKGWEHLAAEGERLEFSPENLAAVFDSLTAGEMIELSEAWAGAQEQDEKNEPPPATPAETSPISSASDSPTT